MSEVENLGILLPGASIVVVDPARGGVRGSDVVTPYVEAFQREISLEPLRTVIDECIDKFDKGDGKRNERMVRGDAWLGPRVHASLRITRAEAATPGIWEFLAAYAFPDYVNWRWNGYKDERFFSRDVKKQAFKRLWWAAELFR